MDRDHTRRAGRGVRPAVVEAVDIQRTSVDGCRSGIAAIAAREPLNACAVHDERAGPADHAAEVGGNCARGHGQGRSEEHTSELQSLMRISYAVCCVKKTTTLR